MATEILIVDGNIGADDWALGAGSDKVSAVQTPDDDDTSYINSGTTAFTAQRFTFSNPVSIGAGDTINSVTYKVRAKRGGAENATLRFAAIAGSDTHGQTDVTTTSSYQDFSSAAQTTAPDGGAWTLDDLNNIGPRVENRQARDVRVTTITAVVDYTPAAPAASVPEAMNSYRQRRG